MLSTQTAALLGGGETLFRDQFLAQIKATVPSIRFLWAPKRTDALTSFTDEGPSPRTITWDATVAARLAKSGHGYTQTFSGTGQFGLSPDTANLTFGNAVTDQAFSVVVLANVTDTAAVRNLVSKFNTTGNQREWLLQIDALDKLNMIIRDEALAVQPVRLSDAAITQAALKLFAMTYSGLGGATAANGITLYQDAAVIASTATNQATYVAMADKTGSLNIGGQDELATTPMQGSLGFVLVCAVQLSAAQLVQVKSIVNNYFGLSL